MAGTDSSDLRSLGGDAENWVDDDPDDQPPDESDYADDGPERDEDDDGDGWDWRDEEQAYESVIISQGIRTASEARAKRYLLLNGRAVWNRAQGCLNESGSLADMHPSASLVHAITAAELLVRFLILRPLIAGLVFHETLAQRLATDAATGSTRRDRELMPAVCTAWDIKLEEIQLNGRSLWPHLKATWDLRDRVVHRGESVTPEQAHDALASVLVLIPGVVMPLATRLDIPWPPLSWTLDGDEADPVGDGAAINGPGQDWASTFGVEW